jgi:hypothetical protein
MSTTPSGLGISRDNLASFIVDRLNSEGDRMHAEFTTPGRISSTYIDA